MKKYIFIAVILLAVMIILGGCNYYAVQSENTNVINAPKTPIVNGNANINTNENIPLVPPTINVNQPVQPKTIQVQIANFAFSPATLAIKAGDTIKWTNNDSVIHTVSGTGWGSESLNTGQSFSYTFNQAGTYDYHCGPHPSMTAKIIVTQ